MALLFMDSFDHSGTVSSSHATKYGVSNSLTVTSSTVRTGTGALQLASSFDGTTKPLPASGGFVVGLALRLAAAPSSLNPLIEVREGTTVHLAVYADTSSRLLVRQGSGTTLATGTTVLVLNNWYYLEFKGTIHDTTGSYALRIDGVAEVSGSGVDTRNGGTTGQWDRVRIAGLTSSTSTFLDDFYVCDQSGAAPTNDFLGVIKIECVLPQTGNGTNVGLTPSTGTDHGALVDENPPNTTDYNASATVGAKDTYNLPSLALTGAILGIQTNLYVGKSDTAARSVCAVVRTGGADFDGASVSPGTTFGYFSEARALNPATGLAWTTADFDALEAGMKVTA